MRRTIEHNTKLSEVSNSRYYISYRHYTAYLAVGDSFAGTRPDRLNDHDTIAMAECPVPRSKEHEIASLKNSG